jgi:outer membrane murein-binding lipoprotein Lpp
MSRARSLRCLVRASIVILGPVLTVALLVAGCAHSSEEIVARQVPASTFDGYECDKIATEAQRISTRMTELKTEVDETAADDELMTTVGILVFPPLLFFIKGDGVEVAEYGRLKGEYATLEAVSAQKQCPPLTPA